MVYERYKLWIIVKENSLCILHEPFLYCIWQTISGPVYFKYKVLSWENKEMFVNMIDHYNILLLI